MESIGCARVALAAMLSTILACSAPALAQETQPATSPTTKAAQGILPIPDYSGDIWRRSYFAGDLYGKRTELAEKGIQFQLDWTNTVQSVVDGGIEQKTEFGGSADLVLNFDLYRMGLIPGGLLKIRAETRYGKSVNGDTGVLLPVNTDAFFPLTSELDEPVPIAITDLVYYQFLSEKFALFYGKIDTLDGDPNEFASGRGIRQFMNLNFVFAPTPLLSVPYSTLAQGIILIPNEHITINSSVFNTADSSTTSGFGQIGEGWTWSTEADFQYRLGSLPGGMNVGVQYAWDDEYVGLNERFIFQPGEGFIVPTKSDTWAAYWSTWQYIYTKDEAPRTINLLDGRPDVRGLGLFARAGFADQDTNPIEYSLSGGIGGRGIIDGRDNDTFGVGYYYYQIQTTRISDLLDLDDFSQGIEAWYNVAITPSVQLTFDIQWVESAAPNIDTAVILGARLLISF